MNDESSGDEQVRQRPRQPGSPGAGGSRASKYRWSGAAGNDQAAEAVAGSKADEPEELQGAGAAASGGREDRDPEPAMEARAAPGKAAGRKPHPAVEPKPAEPTGAERQRRWRLAIAVAVPVLMIAAFAVSRMSGDEPAGPAAQDPLVAYCATLVERDSIPLPNPADADDEETRNSVPATAGRLVLLTEKMLEVAPEDARDGLERQEEAYRTLVRTGDPAGFRSAELLAARNEVAPVDVESCDLNPLEFGAQEYRYTGIPEQAEHGTTSLQMRNEGTEAHEMNLYRRKPEFEGDFAAILRRGAQAEEATPVAGGYAAPGARSTVVAELSGGDYVMFCTLRAGNQAHWQRGMIVEFSVE
ncbi:MAG TPA: hypothetical protein VHL54_10955 [Actinomycetota bacterium]|nr:hypothetical protein [Actinomycetota bacterium]